MTARLFLLQRATALILAPLVLVHLGLIIYAVRNGLSAEEILGRTRSNIMWPVFYWLFVITAGLHGGVGLRTLLIEWGRLTRQTASAIAAVVSVSVMVLGIRAVWAVAVGGAS